ncbi:MAG: NADH-quinone oxidoreductase subunit N [Planctomycetota bacterium]|jgi:NADH-quinone oxidoreductase subunit N|nr:MAG: NADH-quinone oxidoreductase subunit N [Planctomycetota bacterium]
MTTPPTSFESFLLLGPEIALVLAALTAWLGGAFLGLRWGWPVALVGIGAALGIARLQPATAASAGVTLDAFSGFIRWLVLVLGGLLALVQSGDLFLSASSRGPGRHRGGTCEEAGTFLVLLAGLSLTGLASDLVTLFAGLELVSIPTYILLALKRSDARGQEAGLKYFFLSLVASALFLYAIVCLYGLGGSTDLGTIAARLREPAAAESLRALIPVALGMAIVAAAFRLAAVPMHFYAPDVYEGTSPGNAALLSTLPKVAGLVVLARIVSLSVPLELFWQAAAVLAAVTMTVGNVMALWQRNLRRLLACSSIAHAGYLLVGVAVAAAATPSTQQPADPAAAALLATSTLDGMSATLFYLATYAVATIGLFGALAYLGHRWPEWTSGSGPRPPLEEVALVDDLDGLSSTNPVAAFAIALFLLSLAGIPPLPGFWGKLSLAASALQVDWTAPVTFGSRRAAFVALAVVLVVNAAIAAAYYLRIIGAIYFRTTKRGVQADGGLAAGVAMLACGLIVLMVALQPIGLFTVASRAGSSMSRIVSGNTVGYVP